MGSCCDCSYEVMDRETNVKSVSFEGFEIYLVSGF